ncbi:Lethal(2) giant larvae sro7 [Savitreella phatthalungensis]
MSKLFSKSSGDFADLSEAFDRSAIRFDDFGRYGLKGRVTATSFDQVQSLLAVATDTGLVYVLGQDGVEVVYEVPSHQPVEHLHLHRTHLTVIDTRNALYTWNIDERAALKPIAQAYIRGVVTASYIEPSLDWLFLGFKDGSMQAWDLEAEQLNDDFRVKNLYFEKQEEDRVMGYDHALPRFHISPIVSIQMHPTNLGIMLIGYPDGAVLYSVKQGVVKDYYDLSTFRPRPHLRQATFSPSGDHILAAYDNGLLAFFDIKDPATPVQLRTLAETHITTGLRSTDIPDPVHDVLWACREQDPTDTYLLVAGGSPDGIKGVTMLDYGQPPVKATEYSDFFASPRRQRLFPLEPLEEVIALQSLATASPYYNNHAPRGILLRHLSGRIHCVEPDAGAPLPTFELHPTLRFVDPPVYSFSVVETTRDVFASLEDPLRTMRRTQPLLIGGAPAKRRLRHFDSRSLLYSLHGRSVRISDVSHFELIDPPLLEIDLGLVMPSEQRPVRVAGAGKEFVVVYESGAVSIHTLALDGSPEIAPGPYKVMSDGLPTPIAAAQTWLLPIDEGAGDNPSAGAIFPNFLLRPRQGDVSSLTLSQVGFLVVCYQTGVFCVVDMRGPAVIHVADVSQVHKTKEKSLFRRSGPSAAQQAGAGADEYVTSSSVLTQNVEGRLCLVIVLGTSTGRMLRYEILREPNGTFSVVLIDFTSSEMQGAIKTLLGCSSTGRLSDAVGSDLRELQLAADHQDAVILVSKDAIKSIVGPKQKQYKAELRQGHVRDAGLVRLRGSTAAVVLIVVTPVGVAEVYSVPHLRYIGNSKLPAFIDAVPSFIGANGDILTSTDRAELGLMNIFGSGIGLRDVPPDALYDATKQPSIARPVITTWAWLTGTQYVRPADFDMILTGGRPRPLSRAAQERVDAQARQQALLEKRAEVESRQQERRTDAAARNAGGWLRGSGAGAGRNVYGEMERNVAERGERVSQLNDTMDNLGKAANGWLGEIDKFTRDMKKQAAMTAAKSYLPF